MKTFATIASCGAETGLEKPLWAGCVRWDARWFHVTCFFPRRGADRQTLGVDKAAGTVAVRRSVERRRAGRRVTAQPDDDGSNSGGADWRLLPCFTCRLQFHKILLFFCCSYQGCIATFIDLLLLLEAVGKTTFHTSFFCCIDSGNFFRIMWGAHV